MNRAHLAAFLWLRWRLLANQWRRGGTFNAVVMTILVVGCIVLAVPLFFGCVAIGVFALDTAPPATLLYLFDAIVLAFTFFWTIGLLTDLQRTEAFALSKFLHLPVKLSAAFLINYLSSLLRLSLVLFVPVLCGLGIGLAISRGVWLASAVPLVLAFFFMVTMLTYQFQGWLASMMSNPRRRRAIVVGTTAVLMVAFQLPSLLNIFRPSGAQRRAEQSNRLMEQLDDLNRKFAAGEFDAVEHLRRHNIAIEQNQVATEKIRQENAQRWDRTARLANTVLPIGWLPLGVTGAAERNAWPALLGFAGMTLIGSTSLWRAYRTTLRLYQGEFTSHGSVSRPRLVAGTVQGKVGHTRTLLVERKFPGVPEPVAAIALASLRSQLRAPETKVMLLMPILLGVLFASSLFRAPANAAEILRPFAGVGAICLSLFGILQLTANQFGFDRDGFRVYVLSAVPRRDILLGKNLACLPLSLIISSIMITVVQIARPMRIDHFVALAPQFVSMFLLFSMLMNLSSIYAPMPVAAGSLKPAQSKLIPALVQMLLFSLLFPLTQAFTLLPLGIEALLHWQKVATGVPVALLLALGQCAANTVLYYFVLGVQGRLLQDREQKILETVTNRVP